MKRLFIAFVIIFSAIADVAAESQEQKYRDSEVVSFEYKGTHRTYRIYRPEGLSVGAPWVVYTHGYGSATRWREGLNEVARREGFAVCYPDGLPDTRGKDGWNVGYPPQSNLTIDEADFFRALKSDVCQRYGLSEDNAFMAGMSNGGDLCYQLAFTAPGLFRAYGSVAGLLFNWVFVKYPLPQPVPFMEIHGDCDRTSWWEGDYTNRGGWGAYLPVPYAVSTMATANRCCTVEVDTLVHHTDATKHIVRTRYGNSPNGADVELYRVEGGAHSWFAKEARSHELLWQFFSRQIR